MEIQVNPDFIDKQLVLSDGCTKIMMTPPISGDYWLLRVPLSANQAIVAFPKFMTIGIGFQQEEDWNTNLPYMIPAEQIFDHINHNKSDDTIHDADCIAAIRLIQEAIQEAVNHVLPK